MTAAVDIAGSIIITGLREIAKLISEKRYAEALETTVKTERKGEGWQAIARVYRKGLDTETARADKMTKERNELAAQLSDLTEVKEKLAREISILSAEMESIRKMLDEQTKGEPR